MVRTETGAWIRRAAQLQHFLYLCAAEARILLSSSFALHSPVRVVKCLLRVQARLSFLPQSGHGSWDSLRPGLGMQLSTRCLFSSYLLWNASFLQPNGQNRFLLVLLLLEPPPSSCWLCVTACRAFLEGLMEIVVMSSLSSLFFLLRLSCCAYCSRGSGSRGAGGFDRTPFRRGCVWVRVRAEDKPVEGETRGRLTAGRTASASSSPLSATCLPIAFSQ